MLGAGGREIALQILVETERKYLLLQKVFDYHLLLPTVLELSGLCCLPEDYSACNRVANVVAHHDKLLTK